MFSASTTRSHHIPRCDNNVLKRAQLYDGGQSNALLPSGGLLKPRSRHLAVWYGTVDVALRLAQRNQQEFTREFKTQTTGDHIRNSVPTGVLPEHACE